MNQDDSIQLDDLAPKPVEVKPIETKVEDTAEIKQEVPQEVEAKEEDKAEAEDEGSYFQYKPVLVREQWAQAVGPREEDDAHETIILPQASYSRSADIFRQATEITADTPESTSKWLERIAFGDDHRYARKSMEASVNREGADYRQGIPSESGLLQPRTPSIRDKEDGAAYTGKAALHYIRAKTGTGIVRRFPLWHSGFWVTIRKPSEGDLLDLQRQLMEEKVSLGRATGGLAFTNRRVFKTNTVLRFLKDYIVDTTLNVPNNDKFDIFDYIYVSDIPLLFNALISLAYPKGVYAEIACIANPNRCQEVNRVKVNPLKLNWTDYSQLNSYQVNQMSKVSGRTIQLSNLAEYQRHFKFFQSRKVLLDKENNIYVTFKRPTVNQYINDGFAWVNGVMKMVDDAMGVDAEIDDRERMASKLASVTAIRTYQHYVESVESDNAVVMNSPEYAEEIAALLNDITSVKEIRQEFFKGVQQYISDTTISHIAVTNYQCPHCGGYQHVDKETGLPTSELVVLDVEFAFFLLLGLKDQLVPVQYIQELVSTSEQTSST